MNKDANDDYGLSPQKTEAKIEPPPVDYRPIVPEDAPQIGLIGCGGISESHLKAYRSLGLHVVALADHTLGKAESRRDAFYPDAEVYTDYRQVLARDDLSVVDVTPHPEDRYPILCDAIDAGKHVLSQKPFVLNLDDGEALLRRAQDRGVQLAVNQNGRWAPHFSYIRNAVASGLIGEVVSIDCSLQWDQTWIAGIEALESIEDLLLYDFGIHWFDFVSCLMPQRKPQQVWASAQRMRSQRYRPAALASAIVDYEGAQARICLNGHTIRGEQDITTVVGTEGTLRSQGVGLNEQPLMQVFLPEGSCEVPLKGCWFDEGFQGTMCDLLGAIAGDRTPVCNARDNLDSLALCFAAVHSSRTGEPQQIGGTRHL